MEDIDGAREGESVGGGVEGAWVRVYIPVGHFRHRGYNGGLRYEELCDSSAVEEISALRDGAVKTHRAVENWGSGRSNHDNKPNTYIHSGERV